MNSLNKTRNSLLPYAAGILTVGIVAFFYITSIQYSINIPWFDDIENIPYFLVNWLKAPGFVEKWEAFIRPNNEHRVFAARLIVLAQYYLTSKLNFRYLLFCGNLSVLFLFLFIARAYIRQGGKWYFVLPVAFFIFNFQSYAGTFMTIMSMQYQMVILLSVVSFYLLVKRNNRAFGLAILVAGLDTFSMGNGMVVWPSGLAILLLQLRWKEAGIWIVAAVAAIYFYFHGHDFVQGNDKAFTYVLDHPLRTFMGFFTMLGGNFDVIANAGFNKRMLIPTLSGLVLFAIFVTWLIAILSVSAFWGKWIPSKIGNYCTRLFNISDAEDQLNPFWLGTLIYVLISMGMVVFFRTRFDPNIILWSTYKMYPAVMTSVVFVIVMHSLRDPWRFRFFMLMCVMSAGVWGSTLVNYLPIIRHTSNVRTAFAFNQKHNGVGLGATKNSAFETMLGTTLRQVDSLGIYSLPEPLIQISEDSLNLNVTSPEPEEKVQVAFSGDDIIVTRDGKPGADKRCYAFLESDRNQYLFAFPADGLEAICPTGMIREGIYRLGIWEVSSGGTLMRRTDQQVTVQ